MYCLAPWFHHVYPSAAAAVCGFTLANRRRHQQIVVFLHPSHTPRANEAQVLCTAMNPGRPHTQGGTALHLLLQHRSEHMLNPAQSTWSASTATMRYWVLESVHTVWLSHWVLWVVVLTRGGRCDALGGGCTANKVAVAWLL